MMLDEDILLPWLAGSGLGSGASPVLSHPFPTVGLHQTSLSTNASCWRMVAV